jgi:hypothetical protein
MTVRETKENEMSILSLEAERFLRLFIDVCPFKLGHRVTINPTNQYAADWPGVYIITRMQWDYRNDSDINISIASEEEIANRHGDTDGWGPSDLLPAPR